MVIVLDDLHRLTNTVLMADLGRLVDLLPPQVHLVLSTRTWILLWPGPTTGFDEI